MTTAREFLNYAHVEVNEDNLYALTHYLNSDTDFSEFPDADVYDSDGKPLSENFEEPAAFQEFIKECEDRNNMIILEHNLGVAGVDEDTVERYEISEEMLRDKGIEGIFRSFGISWPVETSSGEGSVLASAEDPDVTNEAGKYCDSWLLYREEK